MKTRAAPAFVLVVVPVVALMVMLCGCQSVPAYSPPVQRPSFEAFKAHAARLVSMDDPDASLHFARDIFDGSKTSWEWTGQRPAVKIRIRSAAQLKYVIDFTLPEVTFQETGPVTITFTVNDHVLDRVRYTEQGHQHFEKNVPAGWVEPSQVAIAGAEIDKMWVSKTGGAPLGFILSRIGLVEAAE